MRNSLIGAASFAAIAVAQGAHAQSPSPTPNPTLSTIEQRLANLDSAIFERLGRYEATLARQTLRTVFLLRSARGR